MLCAFRADYNVGSLMTDLQDLALAVGELAKYNVNRALELFSKLAPHYRRTAHVLCTIAKACFETQRYSLVSSPRFFGMLTVWIMYACGLRSAIWAVEVRRSFELHYLASLASVVNCLVETMSGFCAETLRGSLVQYAVCACIL